MTYKYIKKGYPKRKPYGGKGSRGPYGPRKFKIKPLIINKKKIKKYIIPEMDNELIFE